MEKKLILQIVKSCLQKLIEYVKLRLLDELKEGFLKACQAFKETLWEEIKEEVRSCLLELIEEAKSFFHSEEWKEQEEFILDEVMRRINLPLVLKPFKGLIRKIIKSKLERVIESLTTK